MGFSFPLFAPSTPYYTGSVAAIDIPETVVGLAGVDYPIDTTKYRHNGLAAFREGVVQSAEPNDQLFDSQGAWWRYRFSWHHGAGQVVADLERDGDPARFSASRGIDPWTKYEACLLPDTELVRSSAIDGIILVATANRLYVRTHSQQVWFSADLTAWTQVTGLAAENVVDLSTDGSDCYIATTGHIYKVTDAGAGATSVTSGTPTGAFTMVAFVSNRLLAGDNNDLVEVGASTLDVIRTHYQTAFRWTTAFQVGSRIYVGGYAGNRTELYSLTTTDAGALVLDAEAASFFAGELLHTAISYGGSVVLGTSEGIRFASLAGDGTLQYGPAISDAGAVRCAAAQGRFVWFNWDAFPDAGTGLGRLALDTFTDTLTPAYATDVFTEASSADVVDVARFGDRTVFAIAGVGVYATDPDTFVDEGYIDAGEIYFGTVEDKSITEIRARTTTLTTGQSVTLEVADGENAVSLGSGSAATVGAAGIAVNAEGEIVNRITLRVTIGGPGTSTPCLRQWRARAYPIAPGVEEWIVPLIIRRRVITGAGEGQVRSYVPWDEVDKIREHWLAKDVVLYQEGIHAHRVRIDNFECNDVEWDDGAEWFDLICTVRLLSV